LLRKITRWRAEGMEAKMCERCNAHQVVRGLRFCYSCKKLIQKEMVASGYVKWMPRTTGRGPDACENTQNTKYGNDW
jgi:hypothetical protein